MKLSKIFLGVSASMCLLSNGPSLAQITESTNFDLEEIVVTGRKREESLQDIPVSISVVGADLLEQENVLGLGDLADLVPGLTYNQGNGNIDDRIAALPSIRGISSSEIATNRSKVSSFVDGMPILGSVGAINIGGSSQVEVYSGPQSAAFGRSTFAGAINYVTSNPGDEISGSVGVNLSDQGTRRIDGSIGGPINDTLGFQIGASFEDSVSPDADLYTYSDGVESGTRGGNNISARLVWTPTDNLTTKLTFTHDETDDGPNANFFADQASSQECFNSLTTYQAAMTMGPPGYAVAGEFDCDLVLDRTATPLGVNDITAFYGTDAGAAFLATQVANARAAGAVDGEYTVEEAIRLIGDAYSVSSPGSVSDRDRVFFQTDYLLENGSALQFSFMKSEEFYTRFSSGADQELPFNTIFNAMSGLYTYDDGMAMAESDPTDIDETYVEVRWASPAEERIRYVVGASYYEYDFATEIYRDGGYNAVVNGFADEIFALTGENVGSVDTTLSESTENSAIFFNVNYDFTDRLVGSLEGRYTRDTVGAFIPSNGASESITTKTFVPRLGLNYSPNDTSTFYAQYAVGVNPAGVTSDLLDPTAIDLLDNGVPVDLDPTDGVDNFERIVSVNYNSDTYLTYDEETLSNFEVGFKGSAFDGRLSFTAAAYYMLWEDAIQSINLDWDYTFANNDLTGTLVEGFDDLYYVDTTDSTSARVSANAGTSETMGLELQGNYRLTDQWTIGGNVSLMEATYKEFCSTSDYTGLGFDTGAFAGLAVSEDEVGQPCYILDGNELANQPSFTFSLSPSYRTELGNGMQFNASARLSYTGERWADTENVQITPDSYTASLNFGISKDAWSASFYVQNLFDETSVTNGNALNAANFLETYPNTVQDPSLFFTDGANTYSNFRLRYPTGRNFGIRANYRF